MEKADRIKNVNVWISTEELSTISGISKTKLFMLRQQKKGAPWVKIGRSVKYRLDLATQWLDSHMEAAE